MGLGTETPRRNMGAGSQARSDIIEDPRPLVDRQTPVKILPYPELRLRAVFFLSKNIEIWWR